MDTLDEKTRTTRKLVERELAKHNAYRSTIFDHRKNNNLCFDCGSDKHYSRNCKNSDSEDIFPKLPSICAKCGGNHIRTLCLEDRNKYGYCGGCGGYKKNNCCQEGNLYCYLCGELAHKTNQCKVNYSGFY